MSESVHRIVSFLLERLPEGVHLVISGRVGPPLPPAWPTTSRRRTRPSPRRPSRAAGHDYIALTAMGSLVYLRMGQGRLTEADASLRQALGFAAERGAELMPAVGRLRIGLGELLYERDELTASERELTRGTELAERAGELEILVRGQVDLSRTRRARGDTDGFLDLAHKAERLARDSGAPQAIVEAALWKARLHLTRANSGRPPPTWSVRPA